MPHSNEKPLGLDAITRMKSFDSHRRPSEEDLSGIMQSALGQVQNIIEGSAQPAGDLIGNVDLESAKAAGRGRYSILEARFRKKAA